MEEVSKLYQKMMDRYVQDGHLMDDGLYKRGGEMKYIQEEKILPPTPSDKLGRIYSLLLNQKNTIYGGLVHNFSDGQLLEQRNPKYYTDLEKRIIDLFTIGDNAIVVPIGSFTFAIQKYPSDIDINETITIHGTKDIPRFIQDLQRLIKKIQDLENLEAKGVNRGIMPLQVFFSDFKAGSYISADGEEKGIKWTADEILEGYNKEHNISLEHAIYYPNKNSVIKLDVIVLAEDRIIEASTFFVLEFEHEYKGRKYANLPNNFFMAYINTLKKEILKYSSGASNGRHEVKLLKSIKRLWSLARLERNFQILRLLKDIIDSNVSLLGQINADIETIELLLEKYEMTPDIKESLIQILNAFLKKLSTIADIELPREIFECIERAKELLLGGDDNLMLEVLGFVHDKILNVINLESREFLISRGLWPLERIITL